MATHNILEAFRLDGKVALVTGASRGLGQGMALGLAEAGADVVAVSTRLDNLEQTVAQIEKLGRKVLPVACNQANFPEIRAAIAKT
ncbi:MAG: SDR family NAD(P)-dependent oxidoreductase, partial [Calditrichaeota bacterium]|nr:SDR family NAD(P)-dependent oxidoreductase [Calditrichota bacterium]